MMELKVINMQLLRILNPTQYENVLTVLDVADVFNEIQPEILEILQIRKYPVNHATHQYITFQEQFYSVYEGLPLSVQISQAGSKEKACYRWKILFHRVLNSTPALVLLGQIKKTPEIVQGLEDFKNWGNVTQSTYLGMNYQDNRDTNHANAIDVSKSDTDSKQVAVASDANSYDKDSLSNIQDITDLAIPLNANAMNSSDNKNAGYSNLLRVNSSTNHNLSTGKHSNATISTSSNASEDYLGYSRVIMRNYRDEFLSMFQNLFLWEYE